MSASNEVTFEVQETQGTSLFAAREGPYDNRILRCLVIFPAGRPIYQYQTPLELVQALRDAIKAHWSLYSVGNILHRDISENNIIITDRARTGLSGVLIDMDLAKELGKGRSGARRGIGTVEFMAIEVLLNEDHTYWHDLEIILLRVTLAMRPSWVGVCRQPERPTFAQSSHKLVHGDF